MKTTLKTNAKQRDFYDLRDIDNPVELIALIENADSKLKPCPCCESTVTGKIQYLLKFEEGKPWHYFYIECRSEKGCIGCGMQTTRWRSADDEKSVQEWLDFISAIWNRRPGDPGP